MKACRKVGPASSFQVNAIDTSLDDHKSQDVLHETPAPVHDMKTGEKKSRKKRSRKKRSRKKKIRKERAYCL